jgi:glycerol-3-phosphate cytidylyltransferase-like family protein
MIKKISGIVLKWKQLWRTIWFPTVNLELKNSILSDSTFKINIVIDWIIFNWAWVYRKNINLFEWHIFNFDKDIYWKKIEIIILKKIRDNIKIKNLDELKILIKKDVKKIKSIKFNILTFWSFDVVHKWHHYYLNEAKKYWDKLITIIATDRNIEKTKHFTPKNNQENRLIDVQKLNISDEIIIGEEENKLKWLKTYKPEVICLWYDQWWEEIITKYIKKNNLNIKIIRIKSYQPKIYKSSILKNK